jgi:hypothetical protein
MKMGIGNIQICSAGRSGSTLLDMLLGSHSSIHSAGEISHLPKNIALNTNCSCGKHLDECSYWQNIVELLSQSYGVNLYRAPYTLNLGFHVASRHVDTKHQTANYLLKRKILMFAVYLSLKTLGKKAVIPPSFKKTIYNTLNLYDALAVDKKWIVDSSKAYLRALSIYKTSQNGSKIILLTRNGLAVFGSRVKDGYDDVEAINAWKNYYSRSLSLFEKNVLATDLLRIKYEDLADEPAKTLVRICDFIGVQYEVGMLDIKSKVKHILNGNNMMYSSRIKIQRDESWRAILTKEQVALFEKVAGELNRKLGY